MDSILTSIKKLLGMDDEYDAFDTDIIMHINAAFARLNQIGVGPAKGFMITDDKATWKDFIQDEVCWNLAKSYTYLKVKLLFDPPTNSTVMESTKDMIKEFEWSLSIMADSKKTNGEG